MSIGFHAWLELTFAGAQAGGAPIPEITPQRLALEAEPGSAEFIFSGRLSGLSASTADPNVVRTTIIATTPEDEAVLVYMGPLPGGAVKWGTDEDDMLEISMHVSMSRIAPAAREIMARFFKAWHDGGHLDPKVRDVSAVLRRLEIGGVGDRADYLRADLDRWDANAEMAIELLDAMGYELAPKKVKISKKPKG